MTTQQVTKTNLNSEKNIYTSYITEKTGQINSTEVSVIDTSEQVMNNSIVNNLNISSDVYNTEHEISSSSMNLLVTL